MSVALFSSPFAQELPRSIFKTEADGLTIDVRETTHHRWLMFGNGVVQSAMLRNDPAHLVLAYTCSMLAPLIFNPDPKRVLCAGIGGGGFIRFLYHHVPECELTAVDASAAVVAAATDFFELPAPGPRFSIHVEDARETIASARNQDFILFDVFGEGGMPDWISSESLFRSCQAALSEDGILAVNLMPDNEAHLATILQAARHVFLGRVLVATVVDYRNIILLALQNPPESLLVRDLGRQATACEKRFGIPLGRVFRNLCGVNVCKDGSLVI